MVCEADDCLSKAVARSLCRHHYNKFRSLGLLKTQQYRSYSEDDLCEADGCTRQPKSAGLCPNHYARKSRYGDPLGLAPRPTVADRLWARVERTDGCWTWAEGTKTKGGYGLLKVDGRMHLAHRVAYRLLVGEIPDGLELDHLCRNRACVRPDHLEPVTRQENVLRGEGTAAINARKTHCKRGHPLSGENLLIVNRGTARACRTCRSANSRARANSKRKGSDD